MLQDFVPGTRDTPHKGFQKNSDLLISSGFLTWSDCLVVWDSICSAHHLTVSKHW
jgi:hypothetical protein